MKRRFYYSKSRDEERTVYKAIPAMAKLDGEDDPVRYTDSTPIDWAVGEGVRKDAVLLGTG